jgi:hypothetical protein
MLFQFNRVGFCDDVHTKQRRAHFMNLVIYEIQMNNFEFWDHLNIKFLLGFKIFYVRVYFVQKQFFVQLI